MKRLSLSIFALIALLSACKSEMEEAQSRWSTLQVWENQRIEETTYEVREGEAPIGRAVMRIYKGEEDLSRFGKEVAKSSKREEVFRVSLMQSVANPAGMGEPVHRLDSWWFDTDELRLRYGTQSAYLWNGAVFKEIRVGKDAAYITVHSHLSGVEELETDFPSEAVVQAGAGFFIRAVLSSMQRLTKIPVVSMGSVWLSARPTVLKSDFRVIGEEVLNVAGEQLPTRIVELSNEMGSKRYWIGAGAPSLLVQWEDENGYLFVMTGHRYLDWPK
ncbi:MAG: hypothetical protein KDH09_01480 [Chrysiogenetes bacterium]|nr:hypothetical protein [Chrysiogenetes bacterium]